MKRKEILDIIIKNQPLSLKDIFVLCDAESGTKQKRIRRVISDYQVMKKLSFLKESQEYITHPDYARKLEDRQNRPPKAQAPKKPEVAPKKDNTKRSALEDFDYIIEKYKVKATFSPKVLQEAEGLNPKEIEGLKRKDLSQELIVTIDGADAKDLDDAVSLEVKKEGYRLGVHIADVSYYVEKGSRLDKEALKRGNSFYFINKVVPMFPEVLSNGQCSLNPHEDKMTLSIYIELDKNAKVLSYELFPSLIRSSHRLTYSEVESILKGEAEPKDKALKKMLLDMGALARLLYTDRMSVGGIDFDFKEFKIELDEKDEPCRVWLKDRLESERLIEEFMLMANKCVAQYLDKKGLSLFRVHEEPGEEKMQDFIRIISRFGHKIPSYGMITPKDIQKLMEQVKDKPYKGLVNQLLLRSMQQARYTIDNPGHYGLGFEFYTHFTSPIRRYADLVVHRLIKNALHGTPVYKYEKEDLEKISAHISNTERVEVEAERELYKIKSVRYMKGNEGKQYDGIVTGIASFGMFVQLENIGVEGMIRFQDLGDDYYVFNEQDHVLMGRRSKRSYTVGNKLRVEIKKVNVDRSFLDLAPVYGYEEETAQ